MPTFLEKYFASIPKYNEKLVVHHLKICEVTLLF